jgi:hypothetical protein
MLDLVDQPTLERSASITVHSKLFRANASSGRDIGIHRTDDFCVVAAQK